MENKFYVYIHRRPDNQIFYVGKGRKKRAWDTKRNNHWKSIVNKYGGFSAEIVEYCDSEEDAFLVEKFLICSLKIFCSLANKTDGGDGPSGYKHSDLSKARISASGKGRIASAVTRQKMSDYRTGRPLSEFHKRQLKGKLRSEETKAKMRHPKSVEHKAKLGIVARELRQKKIYCTSNGLMFDTINWLKCKGYSKASKSALTACCKHVAKSAYGLKWSYAL